MTDTQNTDPLYSDFRNFLFITWKHLGLPDPTPVQYDIAHFMQHGPKRKMIMAFRGVGKSWIFATYCCWQLYRDNQKKIMIVSASKTLADNISQFIKRLIWEMPELAHLRPEKGQRSANVQFDVGGASASKDPSVKSVGITGQITGSRADIIVADDIESLNNSATQGARETLAEAVKEFSAVLKPDDDAEITYLGTPQSAMSIYGELPKRGYELRIWPAQVPETLSSYEGRLAPKIANQVIEGVPAGTPTDPRRFDLADLMKRKAEFGATGYALQFMLDTSLSDALRYPLKLRDLIVMPLDKERAPVKIAWQSDPKRTRIEDIQTVSFPGDHFHLPVWYDDEFSEYTGAIMAIDPSGTGKDETTACVVKYLHGQLFLTDIGAWKKGYEDEVLLGLSHMAKEQKVKQIVIEDNFGDGMFTKLLMPKLKNIGYPVDIEGVKHSVQKELRIIQTLEPVMNQHRLIVNREVIEKDYQLSVNHDGQQDLKYSLFYQMTHLTVDRGSLRSDDRIDCLAMAVRAWTDSMARDVDKSIQKDRDKAFEADLKKFVSSAKQIAAVSLGKGSIKPKPSFLTKRARKTGFSR